MAGIIPFPQARQMIGDCNSHEGAAAGRQAQFLLTASLLLLLQCTIKNDIAMEHGTSAIAVYPKFDHDGELDKVMSNRITGYSQQDRKAMEMIRCV